MNAPDLDVHERLTVAFAAQVGYRRSELDPNATAIWRRVDDHLDRSVPDDTDDPDDPDAFETSGAPASVPGAETAEDRKAEGSDREPISRVTYRNFETMALRAGVAFLGLDFRRVSSLVQSWRRDSAQMAQTLGTEDLRSTMFGPAEQVVTAVAELVEFLRFGLRTRVNTARNALTSVIDLSAGAGDHDARWVAAHLLQILNGLEISSVWTVFPSNGPDALAQAFTMGSPPVLTLWPPQRDLLTRHHLNPLDPDTKRLLLSVPTSAGKTLLAQIIICHHLADHTGDVCYVTPLRSLGREMRQALATRR